MLDLRHHHHQAAAAALRRRAPLCRINNPVRAAARVHFAICCARTGYFYSIFAPTERGPPCAAARTRNKIIYCAPAWVYYNVQAQPHALSRACVFIIISCDACVNAHASFLRYLVHSNDLHWVGAVNVAGTVCVFVVCVFSCC